MEDSKMENVIKVRHRDILEFVETKCKTTLGCYSMTAVRWYYPNDAREDSIFLEVRCEMTRADNILNDYRPRITWSREDGKFHIHQSWMGECTVSEMEERMHLMAEAIRATRLFESVDLNKVPLITEA